MIATYLVVYGLMVQAPNGLTLSVTAGSHVHTGPVVLVPANELGTPISVTVRETGETVDLVVGGITDINMDGDCGTDADIEAFFDQMPDFDWDGVPGTANDLAMFFAAL